MSTSRKLQGEVERCFKKVSEGVEAFEDIWHKVHNAISTNHKEKYEADLTKEIKKLQRLRDQINSWIASGEIKDKNALVDTRKRIEKEMDRYKMVERESRTKAYSKQGLGAAQKFDPTTREREDLNGWLIASIDSMQMQMDSFESEIESILAAKNKKLDKDKQDRLNELKTSLERHRFHVGKLETLMRMLDNLAVDVNAVRYTSSLPQLRIFLIQVKKIKDDIDYYLESNQEPEFEENEFLYDDIEGLEEFDDGLTGQPLGLGVHGTIALPTSGNNTPIAPVHSSDASDPAKRRKCSDDSSKVVRPVAMKTNHSPSPGVKGVRGTPPKGVGTPNNSAPRSGLSNHVSSLPSLSSSPTHNYHNAKSISNSDSVDNSSADGAFTSGGLSKLAGLAAMAVGTGIPNNLSESGFATNLSKLGVTSSYRMSNSSGSNINSSNVLGQLGGSSNVIGLTSIVGGNQNQQNSAVVGSCFNSSSVSSLMNSITTTTSSAGNIAAPGGLGYSSSTSNLNSSSSGGVSSHNSNSGIWSQEQLQQFQQQHQQGPTGQSGNIFTELQSRDTTPIRDYLRLQSQDQMLLNRILESDSTASINSMEVLDRSRLNLGEHNCKRNFGHQRIRQHRFTKDYICQFTFKSEMGSLGQISEVPAIVSNLPQVECDVSSAKVYESLNSSENKMREAQIPPLLGVAPFGPVPLQKEHQIAFQNLESAHSHMPVSADSQRTRQLLPRNPYLTPEYYPQISLTNSDTLEFFPKLEKLSIETLFFIFYYLEGTKAQFLAAKVLKKQSWRFHTKYLTWFQRHEEPKVINAEFEQGSYIYFDISKWGQRKKEGFIFEYCYLEDHELG